MTDSDSTPAPWRMDGGEYAGPVAQPIAEKSERWMGTPQHHVQTAVALGIVPDPRQHGPGMCVPVAAQPVDARALTVTFDDGVPGGEFTIRFVTLESGCYVTEPEMRGGGYTIVGKWEPAGVSAREPGARVDRERALHLWASWAQRGYDKPHDDLRSVLAFTCFEQRRVLAMSDADVDAVVDSSYPAAPAPTSAVLDDETAWRAAYALDRAYGFRAGWGPPFDDCGEPFRARAEHKEKCLSLVRTAAARSRLPSRARGGDDGRASARVVTSVGAARHLPSLRQAVQRPRLRPDPCRRSCAGVPSRDRGSGGQAEWVAGSSIRTALGCTGAAGAGCEGEPVARSTTGRSTSAGARCRRDRRGGIPSQPLTGRVILGT